MVFAIPCIIYKVSSFILFSRYDEQINCEKFFVLNIVNAICGNVSEVKIDESLKETFSNNRFSHKVLIYLHTNDS